MPENNSRDRIELQDVMLSYAAGVDERDRERYADCFCDNVEVVGFGTQTFRSRDAWVNYVWQALEKYSATQHLLGPQFATINGDDAHTRSDVQAVHFLLDDNARFTLWATYKTIMRRNKNRWQISRHELVVRGTRTD
ncbi:MAG: nuclear transport factor 2 family protein [Halioglobus sp.]|nr:nuclear transport factor 2 family protein [Halioglobus sp.]